MKKLIYLGAALITAVVLQLRAQEPAAPSPEAPPAQSAPTAPDAVPSPTPAIEPPQLIPAPPLPVPQGVDTGSTGVPDLSQLDEAFKQAPLSKESQDYKLHVEWRQLQNRTTNDPAVVAAREHAEAATTDLEKRKRLRDYYQMYYKRMRSLAATPEMQAYLDGQMTAHLGLTAQPRVRPDRSAKSAPTGGNAMPTPLPTVAPMRRLDRPRH